MGGDPSVWKIELLARFAARSSLVQRTDHQYICRAWQSQLPVSNSTKRGKYAYSPISNEKMNNFMKQPDQPASTGEW